MAEGDPRRGFGQRNGTENACDKSVESAEGGATVCVPGCRGKCAVRRSMQCAKMCVILNAMLRTWTAGTKRKVVGRSA